MMSIDWTAFALGALAGAAASGLFFAGLAAGMHLALRAARPTAVLLASAGLRIGLLMGFGWFVAGQGAAALAGFVVAFLVVRLAVLAIVRSPSAREAPGWN